MTKMSLSLAIELGIYYECHCADDFKKLVMSIQLGSKIPRFVSIPTEDWESIKDELKCSFFVDWNGDSGLKFDAMPTIRCLAYPKEPGHIEIKFCSADDMMI